MYHIQSFLRRSWFTFISLYFGINLEISKLFAKGDETLPIRINCGEPNYNYEVNGIVWEIDRNYATDITSFSGFTSDEIANTLDDIIYQSERFFLSEDGLFYTFDLNPGTYSVKLHFNEMYFNEVGQRVFSVKIQDNTVANDLDLYLTAGHDVAYIIEESDVTVASDGVLSIELIRNIENPQICAIEIELVETSDCDDSKISYSSDGKNIFVDCEFNWNEANEYCLNKFGTTLASVTSASEDDAIRTLCMDTTTSDAICWLGGYNFADSSWPSSGYTEFEWVDGTTDISYQNWGFNDCDNCAGTDYCMAMFQWHGGDWDWWMFNCDTHTGAAVCNAEQPVTNSCDESKISVTEDGENIFVDCDFTWYEANEYCLENFGTTLASVTSVSENDAIRKLCMDTTTSDAACWLGGYNIAESAWPTDYTQFEWIDGTTDISFQAWAYTGCEGCAGTDYCMAMYQWHGGEYEWDWWFFNCDTHIGAAVCSAESANPQTECDDSKISYTSDGLNIFVDCAFNWFEANEFCLNKFGTTLSSILSESENEAMKEKCPELTAETYYYPLCWIGAYNIEIDESNEIDFDWIDGTQYYIGNSFEDWEYSCPNCDTSNECGAFLQYHGEPWTWNWWPFDCVSYSGGAFCNAERPTLQPTEEPTEEGDTM